MDIQQFARRMMEVLPQCRRGFFRYEHGYISCGKISLPQFDALEYLFHRKHCLMTELARAFHISKPAATGLIDRLIAQKMVERILSDKDRRVVMVRLTAKGRGVVRGVSEHRRRSFMKVFARISPDDRRQHVKILEQVVKILNEKTLVMVVLIGAGMMFSLSARAQELSAAAPREFTLKECYELALKRSETLAAARQAVEEARGRFLQSLSGVLPDVSFNYSKTYNQGLADEREGKFTFSQPLFSGFKEFAAIAAAKAQGRQVRQEELRARQLLFADVSDAFYYYGFHQEHLKLTQAIVQALDERVEELKKRVELGRSRASEPASAMARLRRAQAQAEQTRGDLGVGRALLEFLTGITVEAVQDDDTFPLLAQAGADLTAYAGRRPDVLAAGEAVTVARKKVTVARAGYWPSAHVEGNAYTEKASASTAPTPGMDVSLKVSVPIFDGAETPGKVREAAALAQEAELEYSRISREALKEIRQAYARWESSSKRVEALQKAVDAAEENYKLQLADFQVSMVNNLDVLQALADLEDVRRDYISALTDMKRFYWDFKVKTGDLDDVHL
ncbi:MAG: TolC family protein [Candidatus Omnitrophica bacterium]|nr:TolC family protein [Candidatus Omnitrophota bacterium]